jgi:ubiquinone/menaquinone biosynthesis C-methylase UbiE
MTADLLYDSFRQPGGCKGKIADWLMPRKSRQLSDWTIEQLNIQPYQHLLEVGYGPGNTLQSVARQLKVGFLAGIDHSLDMYQQAYRKNKIFIEQQLLHLHLGSLSELSYPPHYFHTIYGSNACFSWKDPQAEFIRLSSLLKNNGKLVMVFQPFSARQKDALHSIVEQTKEDYIAAGLTNVRTENRHIYPVTSIAVIGNKI